MAHHAARQPSFGPRSSVDSGFELEVINAKTYCDADPLIAEKIETALGRRARRGQAGRPGNSGAWLDADDQAG